MTTTEARAHCARIMDRLKRLYRERAALPSAAHDFDDTEDREAMGLALLQRLFKAIVGEFVE